MLGHGVIPARICASAIPLGGARMKLGVPCEVTDGEARVGAVPATVKRYVKAGWEVRVQRGAGVPSEFSDDAYYDADSAADHAFYETYATVALVVYAVGVPLAYLAWMLRAPPGASPAAVGAASGVPRGRHACDAGPR